MRLASSFISPLVFSCVPDSGFAASHGVVISSEGENSEWDVASFAGPEEVLLKLNLVHYAEKFKDEDVSGWECRSGGDTVRKKML